MCGRYVLSDPTLLEERFGLEEFADIRLPAVPPRFNIAPSQMVPVIVQAGDKRELQQHRWGFRPLWMKDGKSPPPINARAETVATNGLFKRALLHQRCIVPADGYYEWIPTADPKKKQPYFIRARQGELFGFAGIYAPGNDEQPPTVSIITTNANQSLAHLHHRMPVILDRDVEAAWLTRSATEPEALVQMLRPAPDDRLIAVPVSGRVNSPRNDDPGLLQEESVEAPRLL